MSKTEGIAAGTPAPAKKRRNRKAPGQIVEQCGKRGVAWALRFRLPDGRRVSEKLGQDYGPDAIDRKEAEARAERLLAQVRLGQYRTKEERAADLAAREAERETPFFKTFSEEWMDRRRVLGGRRGTGLSASGENDLSWRLDHLCSWFGGMKLAEIDEAEVERYATAKRSAPVREGGLGATSVNKTLSTLEAILANAVRYRIVDRNVVDGYRVPGAKYRAEILDRASQVEALLNAAGEKDRAGRLRIGHGRALLAVLVFGGLRIGEALALRWRDVDLASGMLRVRDGKTENARRTVDLLPPLRDELAALKARRSGGRDELVFSTAKGKKDSASNVRNRTLAPAVERANQILDKAEDELIPGELTLHGLRHTMISVLLAVGAEAGHVADTVGHADAGFTYSRYRKRVRRESGELDRLRVLFLGATDDLLPGSRAVDSAGMSN